MARIAVEDTLDNVKQALQSSGHEVVNVQGGSLSNCECCVISGQDKNVLGMSDVVAQVPVINAEGMTAEQIVQQVNAACTRS